MALTKNMLALYPPNPRAVKWDEHYCFVSRNGEYMGALYLTNKMREVWRKNGFRVTIVDV